MDRKTVVLVILTALGLVLVNQYFQRDYEERLEKYNAQAKALTQQKEAAEESAFAALTADITELPVKIFCFDPLGERCYGAALVFSEGAFLHYSDERDVAKEVFCGTESYEQANVYPIGEKEVLVGYLKKGSLEHAPIPAVTLPLQGESYLQLLPRERPEGAIRWVELAKAQNGEVMLLHQEQKEIVAPVWAFVEREKVYYPTGLCLKEPSGTLRFVSLFEIPLLGRELVEVEAVKSLPHPEGETFYQLENSYIQVVLSSRGASIIEANLPLAKDAQEANDPLRIREIDYDRRLVRQNSPLARFPVNPAQMANGSISEGVLGGYYPLLRRGYLKNGKFEAPPVEYRAGVIVSEYPELAGLSYRLVQQDAHSVTFEAIQPQRRIRKTFRLSETPQGPIPYCLDLEIQIDGDSRGMWLTSGVPEVEWFTNAPAPVVKYRQTGKEGVVVDKVNLPESQTVSTSNRLDWICNSNGFFGIILSPQTQFPEGYRVEMVPGIELPSRLCSLANEESIYTPAALPGYQSLLPLRGKNGLSKIRLYMGPLAAGALERVDAQIEKAEGKSHSYVDTQEYHGWFSFISKPIGKVLFYLMKIFHYITQSWALAIILLTVALRVILHPLNNWSMKSMAKMREISPRVNAIQEKYKNNPAKGKEEIIQLYRTEKINPASGCLPMLLQMPFLFSMFDLLKNSFELRGASCIPGWIDDLAAPDIVYQWSRPLYFVGNQLHLLPILVALAMWYQQKVSSTLPEDRTAWTDAQKQQATVMNIMTIVFAVMCYHFPAGLNLYWISSMGLGFLQQKWIQRRLAGKS